MKQKFVNLEADLEQIMPIVAKLADKYTSKESSSVSYEVAAMLTEAVVYTVEECFDRENASEIGAKEKDENLIAQNFETRDLSVFYEKGKDIICRKVYEAKDLYEKIIENFQDYGCVNYRDTILKGFPAFFTKYDYKFQPQNHILSLDYPSLIQNEDLTGIDLILQYLNGIYIEAEFLKKFSATAVRQCVMEGAAGESLQVFLKYYMGNICDAVLWRAVCCAIADKSVQDLCLEQEDWREIEFFFEGDSVQKARQKIEAIIRLLIQKLNDNGVNIELPVEYFSGVSHEYAVRIMNRLQA